MARLPESKDVLDMIKEKALRNAILKGTYKTRSVFRFGRTVSSLSVNSSEHSVH